MKMYGEQGRYATAQLATEAAQAVARELSPNGSGWQAEHYRQRFAPAYTWLLMHPVGIHVQPRPKGGLMANVSVTTRDALGATHASVITVVGADGYEIWRQLQLRLAPQLQALLLVIENGLPAPQRELGVRRLAL